MSSRRRKVVIDVLWVVPMILAIHRVVEKIRYVGSQLFGRRRYGWPGAVRDSRPALAVRRKLADIGTTVFSYGYSQVPDAEDTAA